MWEGDTERRRYLGFGAKLQNRAACGVGRWRARGQEAKCESANERVYALLHAGCKPRQWVCASTHALNSQGGRARAWTRICLWNGRTRIDYNKETALRLQTGFVLRDSMSMDKRSAQKTKNSIFKFFPIVMCYDLVELLFVIWILAFIYPKSPE